MAVFAVDSDFYTVNGESMATNTDVREAWLPLFVDTFLNQHLFYYIQSMFLSVS